jgi:hypothetical protein
LLSSSSIFSWFCVRVIAKFRTHLVIGKGGDALKFGEIITAVALGVVAFVFVEWVLAIALVPTVGYSWGLNVAVIVSVFIAMLAVGYVFAGQIKEDRLGSIGRILVLSVVVLIFAAMIGFSANGSYSTYVQDNLRSMYSDTGSWTSAQWFTYGQLMLIGNLAFNAGLGLVFGFLGLYAGSMRKPSAKTKE